MPVNGQNGMGEFDIPAIRSVMVNPTQRGIGRYAVGEEREDKQGRRERCKALSIA